MQVEDLNVRKSFFGILSLQQALLLFILITAAFLRFYHLDCMEFKGDEAKNSFKALKMVREADIPLTAGISSTGINEPPVFMYLLGIPYLFTSNPIFAAGFIALLNVLGISCCYLFVKKWFDVKAALFAAAFFAVNPWHILFSRKIWTQNLLTPFILVFIYLIFEAVLNKKKYRLTAALFMLGIVIQLHLSAAYFALLTLLMIGIHFREISKKELLAGTLAFLTTFIPYFTFQVQHQFVDVFAFLEMMKKPGVFHTEAFTIPLTLATTTGFQYSLGNTFYTFEENVLRLPLCDYLLSGLLLLSALFLFFKPGKKKIIFCVWLGAGLLYIATNKVETIHMHYFHSFYPVFFIAIGLMLSSLLNWLKPVARFTLIAIVFCLLVYQVVFNIQFLNYIEQSHCISGDYGIPYKYRKEAVEKAISPLDTRTVAEKINSIHTAVCSCHKCDLLATKYIVKHLRKDYQAWYVPEQ